MTGILPPEELEAIGRLLQTGVTVRADPYAFGYCADLVVISATELQHKLAKSTSAVPRLLAHAEALAARVRELETERAEALRIANIGHRGSPATLKQLAEEYLERQEWLTG